MPKRTHDGIKKRCGCPRRQWPKCSHPWHFSYHHGGREHRYSLDALALARGELAPRSKAEATTWRDTLRAEIRAGLTPDASRSTPVADQRLTFGDVADHYLRQHVRVPSRRDGARREMEWHVAMLRRTEVPAGGGALVTLESKPLAEITKADVEAVRVARRAALARAQEAVVQAEALGAQAATVTERSEARAIRLQARALRNGARCRPGVKAGEVGINRLLARMRHVFSWAIAEGYIEATPFKRGPVNVVKLEKAAEAARMRRLEPGEEQRLLAHAGPHLRALVVAALTTGCRLGELLSLQWQQVRRDDEGEPRWLVLPAAKTKTAEARVIPVGPRLRAELAMRAHAPDGNEHPSTGYVFGNECGEQVGSIKTAWRLTCRRAGLTDLHFHDLRREFGSRLLESSADLHDVRDFLGHANITTTSRYLKSSPLRLERALARLEGGAIRTPFAQTGRPAASGDENPASPEQPNQLIQ